MIVLVSGATATLRQLAGHPRLGRLFVSADRNTMEAACWPGMPWAMDNGCFSGFAAGRFVAMVERLRRHPQLLFVTVPDVVGDSAATGLLWRQWARRPELETLPLAFVAQDGCRASLVPWSEMHALFVGGTTEFKLSAQAERLMAAARRRGLWVHVGRVNSLRRLRWARLAGADSVDGTMCSRWAGTHLARFLSWADSETAQRGLWEGEKPE